MAIDTAEKRKSVSGIGMYFTAPGITPNSKQDQEWRQQGGWSYSGILADLGIVAVGDVTIGFTTLPPTIGFTTLPPTIKFTTLPPTIEFT